MARTFKNLFPLLKNVRELEIKYPAAIHITGANINNILIWPLDVKKLNINNINIVDLLKYKELILTKATVEKMTEKNGK